MPIIINAFLVGKKSLQTLKLIVHNLLCCFLAFVELNPAPPQRKSFKSSQSKDFSFKSASYSKYKTGFFLGSPHGQRTLLLL